MRALIKSRPYLLLEFLLLCGLIPAIIIANTWAVLMFRFLYGAAIYAAIILYLTDARSVREHWKWDAVTWANMKPILLRFAASACGMVLLVYWYDPDRAFYIARERPEFIPLLMIAYPVLSAFPQELVFCTFFFARYKTFFGTGKLLILASAVVFAYAHILYINPLAPLLSFLGGLIFALTYAKTRSLALVTIEHGLYGNALFFCGLGWYFYSGGVGGG